MSASVPVSSVSSVAFLGLGLMGGGMARRLVSAGFAVTVYNRDPAKSLPFAALGARVAATPGEAAAGAGTVFAMLADDEASRAVWLGADGALPSARPGAVLVECGTVTVEWIHELDVAARARGCHLLDAPVTGSRAQAASGELNFLVGGPAAALDAARPFLAAMGRSATRLGPVGCGARLKLINNFVCGVQVAALAEAVAMIERGGFDRDQALAVLTGGAPGGPLVKAVATRMTTPDYTPNFFLRLMAKDLAYARREAAALGLELHTAAAALGRFEAAVAAGHGARDLAAVVEPLRA
jgi:3-hydroxyisobutyrate dehydrogenase